MEKVSSRCESFNCRKNHIGGNCLYAFFKLMYYLALSPIKLDRGESDITVGRSRTQFVIHCILLLVGIFSFIGRTCTRIYCGLPYKAQVVFLGDIVRATGWFYIGWRKSHTLEKLLLALATNSGNASLGILTRFRIQATTWILILLCCTFFMVSTHIHYYSLTKFGDPRYSFLQEVYHQYIPAKCASGSTEWKPGVWIVLGVIPIAYHELVIICSSIVIVLTGTLYWTAVKNLQVGLDEHASSQQKGLDEIHKFQTSVKLLTSLFEGYLLCHLVTVLPDLIIRSIPFLIEATSFNPNVFGQSLALICNYGSVLVTAISSSRAQSAIQEWLAKNGSVESNDPSCHSNAIRQLRWDVITGRDMTLGLCGLGSFNSSLFISFVSVTATYSVIYYQFRTM